MVRGSVPKVAQEMLSHFNIPATTGIDPSNSGEQVRLRYWRYCQFSTNLN
jgi:hypothetical protein